MASAEKMVTVQNRAGIHARPAALIAQTANKFASEVLIEKDADTTINAKSIMGVITMAAAYNTVLTIKANGSDADEAVNAIKALFDSKFEED
ncbi:MAG: HPr family phosphocarrier protein [Treponema sp.]|nr:HPr family phosphocarrier protein [Candidatus Treponema caballi]